MCQPSSQKTSPPIRKRMEMISALSSSIFLFFLVSFANVFRKPMSIENARPANISMWTILSGPSHSQNVFIVGKQDPGKPHSIMIMVPQIMPGRIFLTVILK